MHDLQDLLQRLRRRRQQLDRISGYRQSLETLMRAERKSIERRLGKARQGAQRYSRRAEQLERRRASLDRLPPGPAGQIGDLQKYDFVDPKARRLFQTLLDGLREQMRRAFSRCSRASRPTSAGSWRR
jgi:hypothetical protein